MGGRRKGVWDSLASCKKGPEKKYCKVVESTGSGGLLSHLSPTPSRAPCKVSLSLGFQEGNQVVEAKIL